MDRMMTPVSTEAGSTAASNRPSLTELCQRARAEATVTRVLSGDSGGRDGVSAFQSSI
jgi:hypothetical protein